MAGVTLRIRKEIRAPSGVTNPDEFNHVGDVEGIHDYDMVPGTAEAKSFAFMRIPDVTDDQIKVLLEPIYVETTLPDVERDVVTPRRFKVDRDVLRHQLPTDERWKLDKAFDLNDDAPAPTPAEFLEIGAADLDKVLKDKTTRQLRVADIQR